MAGASTWVVTDPLTLEHFHFSVEEHALLEMLRRRVSLTEMSREFARQFPPRTITERELWAFLSRLHEAGLLMSDAPGQGGSYSSGIAPSDSAAGRSPGPSSRRSAFAASTPTPP